MIDSGLPWTILRATQFYDMILSGAKQLAKLPVVPAPAGFEVQPIHPDDVAARLVELAIGEPAGRTADLGGPEKYSFADLLRVYMRVTRRRRPIIQVWMPRLGKIRDGALLPNRGTAPGRVVGHRTWEEFLTERLR